MQRPTLSYPANLWFIGTDLLTTNGYGTEMSPNRHLVPLAEPPHYVIDPANSRGAFDDRTEHRLHVRGRTADDTKHLGSRDLMFQCFAQFRVAFLQLFEQADVLNRDHRLRSERFQKLN